jgi:trimeric autotransporter adhesin
MVGLACLPAGSALTILTNQATATANTLSTAASFPMCYRDAVTANSPVSYWRLDETSGTTAADSQGGRNGTYTNGVTLGQSGALPDSVNNKAASFDGVDDRVVIPYAAALNPSQFTFEAWANPTSGAGYRTIAAEVYEIGGVYRGIGLYVSPSNTWRLFLDNGAGQTSLDGPAVRFGEWTHLAWSYDGTTLKLYVNGTLAGSAAGTFSANTSAPLSFGMWTSDNSTWYDPYTGLLDDVSLVNSALSASQIRTHYNTGRCYKDGMLADGPLGYWRLGESSGNIAAEGMHGYDGTYYNTPTLGQTGALNLDANTAVTFNGTNNRVVVPYKAALNPAQVTVEAWVKPTGGSGTNRAVADSFYDDGAGVVRGFLLGIDTSNRWWLALGNGTAYKGATATTATLNVWTHVVGTFDGTTARLYVNGLLAGSAAASYAANAVQPVTIGAWPYLGSWVDQFTGSLDEVAVYSSALSAARVQAHYLLGRSYKDTVLDAVPVSFWRLGEGSGTSAADSKGSNTGTYTNSPTLAQTGVLAGDSDTAVSFNATNTYVNVPYTSALNPAQFTVEAWAIWDGTRSGAWRTVLGNWNDGAGYGGLWLGIHTNGQWVLTTQGSSVSAFTEIYGPAATTGPWVYLTGTYDGSTMRFYVNGAEVGNTASPNYLPQNAVNLAIGGSVYSGGPADWFGGRIDDVALYNRALTATEVQLHYDSGRQ